jgi:hypothetical protein
LSRWILGIAVVMAGAGLFGEALGQSLPVTTTSAPASQPSIEDEVLANLHGLAVGERTLDDWNLPDEYLRRVADRIIRASYERNFRRVVRDGAAESQPTSAPAPVSQPSTTQTASVTAAEPIDAAYGALLNLREARPPLRSFRAPLRAGDADFPFEPPSAAQDAEVAAAAQIVARELAREGLLKTAVRALESLGSKYLEQVLAASGDSEREAALRRLAATGLPVDWLAAFADPNDKESGEFAVLRQLAGELSAGRRGAALDAALARLRFRPRQTLAGFALATECGETDAGEIDLQISRATDWLTAGDGGALDVLRQIVARAGGSALRVLATGGDAGAIVKSARAWPAGLNVRLVVHSSPLPVAQWAQDSHKFGRIGDGVRRIVPRYPTRGEDGGTFVPGEAAWGCVDPSVVHSPLLFQGGNLLCVRDPARRERTLLLGEAEVHRNSALGLEREQVLEAFRVEMGVDRCVVLPAASFHIDFEICVRVIEGKPVAFVNDADAARKIVLACGIDALERGGTLDSGSAQKAREALAEPRAKEFISTVGNALYGQALDFGVFPKRVADSFSTGPADSGVGNFLLFLHAIDSLLALSLKDDEVPNDRPGGYLRAVRRDAALRAAFRRQIQELGWPIVPVPGMSNGERGITYINGIHTRSAYWMPAWGGLYTPLDDAAAQALRSAFGAGVEIVPIRTSETQRRGGGLHCALSVAPRPD